MRMPFLGMTAVLALGVAACGVGDESTDDEGRVGSGAEAQIDPSSRGYLIYAITQNGVQLGNVLVTNTAGGGYAAKREYWYLTANPSMSAALTFTGGAATDWSTPPSGLGTLSFTMNQQATWASSAIRGNLLGSTNALTGEGVRISWNMSQSGGVWSGYIVWYHSSATDVFGAGTTTALSPTTSHPGTWYSYVSNPL